MRKGLLRLGLLTALCVIFVAMAAAPALARAGTIRVGGSSGPPGINVSISGEGFTPNSSYTVFFGTRDVAHGVIDVSGSFSTTFAVPERAQGRNVIKVETSAYDISNTASFDIVTGAIRVIPSVGPPGTKGTLSGEGFTAGSTFTASFGTDIVATGTIGPAGSFSTAFTVPADPRGQNVITVKTSAFDAAVSVPFEVAALQKPYSPVLLAPVSGATVSTTPSFNWSPVMGAVSYQIIITTDSALANTVAGTPAIVSKPSFQVTKPLDPGTSYFWSVQVISPDDGPPTVGTFYTAPVAITAAPAPTVVLPPSIIVEPGAPVPAQPGPVYVLPIFGAVPAPASPAPFAAVVLIGAIFVAAVVLALLRVGRGNGGANVDENEASLFLALKSGSSVQPLAEALVRPGLAARALREFEGVAATPPEAGSLLAALSPQQKAILESIAAEKTLRQTAKKLHLEEETLRQELEQVADKLVRNSRARAAIERLINSLEDGSEKGRAG